MRNFVDRGCSSRELSVRVSGEDLSPASLAQGSSSSPENVAKSGPVASTSPASARLDRSIARGGGEARGGEAKR